MMISHGDLEITATLRYATLRVSTQELVQKMHDEVYCEFVSII